jgi:hypothetical protein
LIDAGKVSGFTQVLCGMGQDTNTLYDTILDMISGSFRGRLKFFLFLSSSVGALAVCSLSYHFLCSLSLAFVERLVGSGI